MGKFSLLTALGILVLLVVAYAMPQPGSYSFTEESAEVREFMEEMTWSPKTMEESTENYEISEDDHVVSPNQSSEVVLDDETEEMVAAKMCAKTAVKLNNFLSDIDTLSNETRTAFFSQYCPRLERTALCMIDDLKAKRPYFEEDDFIIVKAQTDNYPAAVELVCKNDGEILFNLADPTTKKCVEKLWDDVMEHREPFADEFENWDISHLTQAQCETVSKLRQYIERELNVCKAPDLISVYDLFHNTLFSVTTCRNYVLTMTEAGLMTVVDATPQPGLDSSVEESVEAREIMEESPEIYGIMGYKVRNGSESDEPYEDETDPMRAAIMCAENSVDLEKFMSDIDTLSNETRTAFFSQYCPQLERTALCMHDVVEATRPLLEEDVFIIVKALTDNYPDAVDLICKNDGEMIFNLANPTTKKCVEKLWDDVVPFADEVKNWDISDLTQIQCEILSELRQYIEGKLNVCKAMEIMSVYDLFHNTLFSVTTCRNYELPEAGLMTVADVTPQSGLDSSVEESVKARKIVAESPEIYGIMGYKVRNGSESDEPYEDETDPMRAAIMCAENSVDLEKFMSDIDTLSNETRTAFFSQYCPQLERTALCMHDVVKATRPLLEEDVFIIVKALTDNYPDAVDLICKNDGEMIFKLADPTIKMCVEKLWHDVVPFADEVKNWDISHLTQTQCNTFSTLRHYIEAKLNACKAMEIMSVYDLFHNTLFSVTTCRNYELPEAGLMTVADVTPQSGLDSSLEESVEARKIMAESPEIYGIMGYKVRNGSESDEPYEDETDPMRAAIMCAENSVDLEKFMSDIDTLSNETRTAFFSQYCPQLERTALCMHDVVEATRPLLEEDVFIIVKALTDNYPDAVDLICKNDGEMIFNLANPTTKKCVEKLWDDVMEHMGPFADDVENWDISHLTQAQCETLSGLRQYIKGKLNVCQAADLMSVYDLFHNTLFSVTTCRNFVTKVTEIENNTVNEN